MKHIIWIDVSRNKLDISIDGKNHTTIRNNINDILKFFKSFDNKNYTILFEATWIYSNNLIKVCNDLQLNYFIITPTLSHNLSISLLNRNSNDKLDAKKIAQMGKFLFDSFWQFPPILCKPISNDILKLKSIHRAILSIKKQIKVLKNNLEVELKDPFSDDNIISYYKDDIDSKEEKIKELYDKVLGIIDKMWYSKHLKNLQTIPSIWEISSIELIILFLELKNRGFTKKDGKKVKAFMWIEPNEKKSWKSVSNVKISKKWRGYLRKMLFMNALLWFKMFKSNIRERYKDTNIWKFFDRMKDKFGGDWWKRWYSITTAMINKLVQVAWWIFWNNQPFDYSV